MIKGLKVKMSAIILVSIILTLLLVAAPWSHAWEEGRKSNAPSAPLELLGIIGIWAFVYLYYKEVKKIEKGEKK